MSNKLAELEAVVRENVDLSPDQMRLVIAEFLGGRASSEAMRGFLVALAQKGETAEELVGAALAMRDAMIPIAPPRRPVVDTCGTGGDGSKTFNISTAAAIVAAAAGVVVAKHGNRKITSSTGSADVLAEMGLNLDASVASVQRCLNETGLCFCFAPLFHPAMKNVAATRREIPHPTIFNRLGPLCNPANADCQILGVGDIALQGKLATALQQLGTRRSLVVRGADGVDEVSTSAATRVLEVTRDSILEHTWHPSDFGLAESPRSALFADSPASSAECIQSVLRGEAGGCRTAVVINAAAAIWLVNDGLDLADSARRAEYAIDSGAASRLLDRVRECLR